MKRFVLSAAISLALLALHANPLASQEQINYDEIFCWFPAHEYLNISFIDIAGMKAAETFPLYLEFICHGHFDVIDNYLPPTLLGHCSAFSEAVIQNLKFKKGKGPKILSGKSEEETEKLMEEGAVEAVIKGDSLRVWILDDVEGLLKEALKEGEISDSGLTLQGRPIYTFRTDQSGGEVHAYATVTGELLTVHNPANLEGMVAAGMGMELSIQDDPDHAELLDAIHLFGQHWIAVDNRQTFRRSLKIIENNDKIDPKHKEFFERQLEEGKRFSIQSFHLDDQIESREIYIFGTDDFKDLNTGPLTGPRDDNPGFSALKSKKRTEEIHHNVVVYTVVYDEELLKKYKEITEEYAKEYEQRQAAQDEKKKDEKNRP